MLDTNQDIFSDYPESQLLNYQETPKVRLKMVGRQEFLEFELKGNFCIKDGQDNTLTEILDSNLRWRAQVDAFTPPTYQYILFVVEVLSEPEADEITESLKTLGNEAWHRRFGYQIHFKDGSLSENFRYRIFIGPVPNKQNARSIQTKLLGNYRSQIFKVPYRKARGFLEISDVQVNHSFRGAGFIRVEPTEKGSSITVLGIYNNEGHMSYTFRHAIEFHIADDGRLFMVGELGVDEYVQGVVTAIYDKDYPEEFLKASIVAYHSTVISNLGMTHINEPYDYCRTEHCFDFEWREKVDRKLKKMLREVKGKFLWKGDIICDARQHPLCGGHTEHINLIMNRNKVHAVSGRFDVENKYIKDLPKNLRNEKKAEKWISSRPNVLCNFRDNEIDGEFERYRQDFRWVVEYSRHEIEKLIKQKTEEYIGTIIDIVPLFRGGSGRLLEVEVLGSHKNVLLMGEQDIRNTLSESVLPSSFFQIEVEWGVDGVPSNFIFTGAGKGHGVGMCQAGAIAIAQKGYNFMEILKHYFGTVELVFEYPVSALASK